MKLDLAMVALLLLVAIRGDAGCADPDNSIDLPTEPPDTMVNSAPADVAKETDLEAVEAVWSGLKEAMKANDIQLVGQFFTEASRNRYLTLYGYLGSEMAKVPSTWSDFTAIELTDDIAVYAFTQSEPSGDRMYQVVFVRVPEFGWLIQEM